MPWTRNERLAWGLQDFSDRYHIGWVVPKDDTYSIADDQRSRAAQRILGEPESKIGTYPYEQLYGTNDNGDGGWVWHPSLYWTGPHDTQNHLRLVRHVAALRVFRETHGPHPGLALFDGAHVAAPAAACLLAARKSGYWNGTIPDIVYGGFRTYAQQAVLYAQYRNSGWDPSYIAASPDRPSHHQLKPPNGYAVDVSNHEGLRSYLKVSGDKRLVPYGGWGNDDGHGDGDTVHFSDNGG